ncbi:MAG: hypothetical protein KBB86_02440 [Candidatus Pacebacteria bacterium]|nr:hypothetical protein [Candidatus Paceibacterota bacterium]
MEHAENDIIAINAKKTIDKYVELIKNGESKDDLLRDMPLSFTTAIEKGLNESPLDAIPSKWKALVHEPDLLEEMWTVTEYVDEAKNAEMKRVRALAIAEARAQLENSKNAHAEELKKINHEIEVEEMREKLDIDGADVNKTREKIEKKKYEWDNEEHKHGVDIYNQLVNLANGLAEGFASNFIEKVAQYGEEIKKGTPKEKVLQGAQKTMIAAVEEYLKNNPVVENETPVVAEKTEQEKKADQITKFFDLGNMDEMNKGLQEKYAKYAEDIRNGQPEEKVLQGASNTTIENVRKLLSE